jgi:hypothetical protein
MNMNTPVNLNAILQALEMATDEATSYLNKKTGEVEFVQNDFMRAAEENKKPPEWYGEWERDQFKLAQEILASDNYLSLPSKWDVHEWDIMREFCESLDDEEMRDDLLDAIHGSGAFRMFKDRIHRYNIQNDWYRYRNGGHEGNRHRVVRRERHCIHGTGRGRSMSIANPFDIQPCRGNRRRKSRRRNRSRT